MTCTETVSASQDNRPQRMLGSVDIARWFGVNHRTISKWRVRGAEYGHPFPSPDVEITTGMPNVYIPGWLESRKKEIFEWRQTMPGSTGVRRSVDD